MNALSFPSLFFSSSSRAFPFLSMESFELLTGESSYMRQQQIDKGNRTDGIRWG
jgi:hypothetical protein